MERKFTTIYKGVEIDCYRGSNFVYIKNRPFNGLLSAKRWINKNEKTKISN